MELDVHIDRVGEEPWGFRLIGGVDFDMPLTVVKVLPDSPAERAGLRNGDTVQYINDIVSTDMSHEDSRQAVAAATDTLTLGVTRGLYDPVLDDQEPIFEPIDQEDFDQPSRPTEVPFCLQEFTDTPKQNELPDFFETPQLPESRSLTASPFLVSTKPYRPFSTEPLPEIPPLENPIILNPEYNDVFDKLGLEDFLPKTRFKLPISEQYAPDGTENCQNITKQIISTEVDTGKMGIKIDKEEFSEKMIKEKIVVIANSLVDESIERATTVAAEIKKEIDIELRESSISFFDERESTLSSRDVIKSNLKKQTVDFTSEASSIKSKETASKNAADLVSLIDKTTEVTIKHSDVSVAREVEKFEKVDTKQQSVEERRLSTKQNIEEAIIEGSVKSKSSIFNKETELINLEKKNDLQRKKCVEESKIKDIKTCQNDVQQKFMQTEKQMAQSTVKSESVRSDSDTKRSSDTKMSTSKLLAEQRAYVIGLQTIPNIKGTIHSSYHYNLLLKTFFVHLTDVMVALSRFILAEPVLSNSREEAQEQKQNLDTKETVMETVSVNQERDYENISETVENSGNMKEKKEENTFKDNTYKTVVEAVKEKIIQDQQIEAVDEEDILNGYDMEEGEKRILSGAKMAQLTERKSEELTCKMEAVISEFQNKTGIEETAAKKESIRERRSRSRSKAQEVLEIETSLSKLSSSVSESVKLESSHESKDVKGFKSKDGKQMYIAIVESHVYTNKDAILEDQVTVMVESSAASVQTAEKTNIALEANEAVSTENVAMENLQVREEVAKTIIEETCELSSNVRSEVAFQIIEQKAPHSKEVQIEEISDDSERKELVESKVIEERVSEINQIVELAEETKPETIKSAVEIEEISELEVIKENVSEVDQSLELTEETQKESVVVDNTESANPQFRKLKVNKKAVSDVCETEKIVNKEEVYVTKQVEVAVTKNKYESFESKVEESFVSQQIDQASTFVAKSVETAVSLRDRKEALTLNICKDVSQVKKLESQISASSDEDISTPTPSTVPPTPLTDEYIFKLKIALPKGITPIPPDLSPDSEHDEDPHIVKKNLVPHIETKVEEGIIYDPPLPTPPASPKKVCSPVYTKPGLRGGADRKEIPKMKKEEILEIERKSSLLASAIDQTIRSIEEYKEDVGIETKKQTFKSEQTSFQETPVIYNGYAKVVENKIYETPVRNQEPVVEDKRVTVDKQITSNIIEESKSKSVSLEIEQVASKVDFEFNRETVDVIGKEINASMNKDNVAKTDPIEGYRPVQFNLEEIQDAKRGLRSTQMNSRFQEEMEDQAPRQMYMTETGEVLGTHQGIVDGLEEAVVDAKVAKEQGKPGITEDKIAELISGESEMLREAHVMGLSRVITSHMHRANDDSSVDFNKIKPTIESLNRSEVLKALNEELMKTKEEKKKDDRKWTTFLQKPKRAVPRVKFGYYGYTELEEDVEEPYKVKIVKQPKPKVAPDYKSEDFNTGLLPWEERALREPTPPPVAPEEPILIPEEAPEILEAVDPLPESEVPDLEDSGIPLPSPTPEEDIPEPVEETEVEEDLDLKPVEEETVEAEDKLVEEMDQSNIAEQIMMSVQNMVDANAPLEQQLAQMRAQLVALAQLPGVIQQSLELVSRQLGQLSQMESAQTVSQSEVTPETNEESEDDRTEYESEAQKREYKIQTHTELTRCLSQKLTQNHIDTDNEEVKEDTQTSTVVVEENGIANETQQEVKQAAEEFEEMRREEEARLEEQRKIEKQRKEIMEQARLEQESRQLKQRPTPRVGKPKPVFGPATPQERPVVLPGGRRWRKPEDAYNEQFINETLSAQAEIIRGKAKGFPFESVRLPYDERINFMKYEKPPVSLDHLQNSDTYKMIHNMEQAPVRRVDMLTPVIAEADYREKCRSITPCTERMAMEEHLDIPQQVQP